MNEKWFGIDRKDIHWFPTIDFEKCIGCMACINKCKKEVYTEDKGTPKVVNPYNCVVGCTGCQNVCPENAISHPPKKYLEKLSNHKDFKSCCCNPECDCGDTK